MMQGGNENNHIEVRETAAFLGMLFNQNKKTEEEWEGVKMEAFSDDDDDSVSQPYSKKRFKNEARSDCINGENKIMNKKSRGRPLKTKKIPGSDDEGVKEYGMQGIEVGRKLDVKFTKEEDFSEDEDSEDDNDPDFSDGLSVTNDDSSPRKRGRKIADGSRRSKMQSYEFPCNQCFMRFKSTMLCNRHMLRKHDIPMPCEKCDETFVVLERYHEHMKINHPSHICIICGEQKFTKAALDTHIESQHQGNVPCPFCGKEYTTKASLNLHIGRCHGDKETLMCTKCDYKTNVKHEMKGHYIRRHTELNKQTCESCGEVFKNLKGHLERTPCGGQGYLERKKVPCIQCDKTFSNTSKMREHIKIIHGNVKDKICSLCSYATYSNYNLKLHVSKMHLGTGLVKEVCPFCEKETSGLKHHIETYHSEQILQ